MEKKEEEETKVLFLFQLDHSLTFTILKWFSNGYHCRPMSN